MTVQHRHPEVHSALTTRVRARLRALRDYEAPPDADIHDHRMVEYGVESHGMVIPGWFDFVDPLRDLSLLERFSHLFGGEELPGEEELVDFYATFGPLNETIELRGDPWPAWLGRLEPQVQERLLQDPMTRWCEPLWWLHERGREVRLTFRVYEHLRRRQFAALRSLFGSVPAGKRVVAVELVAGRLLREVMDEEDIARPGAGSVGFTRQEVAPVPPQQRPRPLTEEECVMLANRLLAQQLNLGEADSHRRWQSLSATDQPPGRSAVVRIVRVRSTSSLTAALYLQLGEAIEREAPLRQCQGCGRIFHASRPNRVYCRPQCGDAARQRAYYRSKADKPIRPRTRRSRS